MCSCKPAPHSQATPSCGRGTSEIEQAVVAYANRRISLDTLTRVTGATYVESTYAEGKRLTRIVLCDEDFVEIMSVRLEVGIALSR